MIELNTERITPEQLSGFRLQRFELRNWGTFDNYIWIVSPNGYNALLTGDIGSGKSTIVDAITTLLVRQDRIIYNKAAGAETKERTGYTYIRGAFKNEKSGSSGKSQDVFLRDENTYSVLLGHFYNEGFDLNVTLAQVFWIRNGKPDKFFVISTIPLTIKEHFSDFGTDIYKLKRRLKQPPLMEVFDSYSEYASKFRQHFGIRQPEALDLFYQTVSMKSVGNLTDFVREQMLGKTDIQIKVNDLVASYQELTKAHDAAQRARHQRELLQPLMENIERLSVINKEITQFEDVLHEIPLWFSIQRILTVKLILKQEASDYFRNENAIRELTIELQEARDTLRQLEKQRDGMEESRLLQELESRLSNLEEDRSRKEKASKKYTELCKQVDLPAFLDEDVFYKTRLDVQSLIEVVQEELTRISSERSKTFVEFEKKRSDAAELEIEINSLEGRQTLIPSRNIRLRKQILDDLQLDEQDLPYAGELIRVKESEQIWEGAIERRLHDLGLSMLVSDRHYQAISQYVDDHHLNGRLVYLRVFSRHRNAEINIQKQSLVNKVEIKHDTEFFDWLEAELLDRHNFICCSTLEEFHREPYAITKSGQIRSGKVRYEKNDSRLVTDRSNYVLGWSNADKIEAYRTMLHSLLSSIAILTSQLESFKTTESQASAKRDALRDLTQFSDYAEVNIKKVVSEIQSLTEQKKLLEAGSLELKLLQGKIEELSKVIFGKDKRKDDFQQQKGKLADQITRSALVLRKNMSAVGSGEGNVDLETDVFVDLEANVNKWNLWDIPAIAFQTLTLELNREVIKNATLEYFDNEERNVISRVNSPNGLLDKKKTAKARVEKDIVLTMERYLENYQAATADVDASIESIPDFEKMYQKLVVDDIPKYEEKFKRLLKEGTINGILVFRNQLDTYGKDIDRKISEINKHLVDIAYNTGTFIKITQDPVLDVAIADFKNDLRVCLENIYGQTDDYYDETKFNQVKKILDRFKGEKDEDKRWTERVTDVREWYSFGASERFLEDDKEKEYYSDSSGKSGGQKEKLAYTILASAIAFQFGLSWGEKRSRSFRFVIIDEAFGRGSDESTRYGLQLFKKLNLQLIIVTPLQKINIIEDYINAVHFVSNPTGQTSVVRTITKEDYLKEKSEYFLSLEQSK